MMWWLLMAGNPLNNISGRVKNGINSYSITLPIVFITFVRFVFRMRSAFPAFAQNTASAIPPH